MRLSTVLPLAFLTLSQALPAVEPNSLTVKPAAFFLAGDSTTATQSIDGGGWGDGFLNKTLVHGAIGTNFGHNGRTTVSFVAGGDWAKVLNAVNKAKGSYTPYVTIQFGHNDQKASANISLAQYQTNLQNLAKDVFTAGGTPILVTPLSRRGYNSAGLVIENLAQQAAATLAAAANTHSAFIDLNKASTKYLNAIGQADASKYNLNLNDTTHLNVQGSVVFGNMVAELIRGSGVGKEVWAYLSPQPEVVKAIQDGVFYLPVV